MTEPEWLSVWLQGGEADGHRYHTLIEPERVLYFIPDPRPGVNNWIHVDSDWSDAVAYERVRGVEQFDHERIYYPVVREQHGTSYHVRPEHEE